MRIIGGQYRGKKLVAPAGMETRPTSDRARESLFNIIDSYFLKNGILWRDIRVLDVFAGTGAVGIEAVSRGAKEAFLIENHLAAIRAIRANKVPGITLIEKDVFKIGPAKGSCTLVFLDPPYLKGLVEPALRVLTQKGWIGQQALVVAEMEKNEQIHPVGFEIIDERVYGKAKFIFLRRNEV